ncbi:hypothetical protein TeGR_g12640, partial [Tetraparma gracilis]
PPLTPPPRYRAAFEENPLNREAKAEWDRLHPAKARAAAPKWSLPADWSCEEKARVPPSQEKRALPDTCGESVRATFGTFQGWFEERTKSTAWFYPVLSVDPGEEVGELRKTWDRRHAKSPGALLLLYYGLGPEHANKAYAVCDVDDAKLIPYEKGAEMGLREKYEGQTGRKAKEILKGIQQLEEDRKRPAAERGQHMKVPDAQLPAEKVMIDRFYTHVPSKVVCRSVVEVKAVIKIMEDASVGGVEAMRRYKNTKKEQKEATAKLKAAGAGATANDKLEAKPMPATGAKVRVRWIDSNEYIGKVGQVDRREKMGKKGELADGFILVWDEEDTQSFVPLTGDWALVGEEGASGEEAAGEAEAGEEEDLDFGEDSDDEEENVAPSGEDEMAQEKAKAAANMQAAEQQQQQQQAVPMELQQ